MIELEISDAAVDAADIFGGQALDGDLREQLDRAAPLIVAPDAAHDLAREHKLGAGEHRVTLVSADGPEYVAFGLGAR